MNETNYIKLEFPSRSSNEGFARAAAAAFAAQLDPNMEELGDIRTAVSEAVTNAIVHGYEGTRGLVTLRATLDDKGEMYIEVEDQGQGIPDIAQAMEPFYTTHPEQERSGMGFAVMQTFMDDVEVVSAPGQGTCVKMRKRIHAGGAL